MKRTILFMELDEVLVLVREGALEATIQRLSARHGWAGATLFFDVMRLGPEERAAVDEAHRCGMALVAVSPRCYFREPSEADASAIEAFIAEEVTAHRARQVILPESYGEETPLARTLRDLRIEVRCGARSFEHPSAGEQAGFGVVGDITLL